MRVWSCASKPSSRGNLARALARGHHVVLGRAAHSQNARCHGQAAMLRIDDDADVVAAAVVVAVQHRRDHAGWRPAAPDNRRAYQCVPSPSLCMISSAPCGKDRSRTPGSCAHCGRACRCGKPDGAIRSRHAGCAAILPMPQYFARARADVQRRHGAGAAARAGSARDGSRRWRPRPRVPAAPAMICCRRLRGLRRFRAVAEAVRDHDVAARPVPADRPRVAALRFAGFWHGNDAALDRQHAAAGARPARPRNAWPFPCPGSG